MTSGSMVVLNGELLPRSGARIGVDDAGFLLGDGVFETMRAEAGVPLHFDAHLARLERSLAAVAITLPWRLDELRAQVALVLDVNGRRSGSTCVRITVTRGVAQRPGGATRHAAGEDPGRAARRTGAGRGPTVLVTADPYEPPPRDAYEHGVDVEISPHVRQPHPMLRVKSTSYAGNLWQRREASRPEIFEVLQFNTAGSLAEGSFTNVFLVDAAGELRTPAVEDGCLEGVTRNAILDLARERGMRSEQGGIDRARLEGAAEIFLTNSLVEVVPVRSLGGRRLASPSPGPLTRLLAAEYLRTTRANPAPAPPARGRRAAPGAGFDRPRST